VTLKNLQSHGRQTGTATETAETVTGSTYNRTYSGGKVGSKRRTTSGNNTGCIGVLGNEYGNDGNANDSRKHRENRLN
jgi:hypothetical protein